MIMKKAIFIVLLLSTFNLSAQNYDLIVSTKGDSIDIHQNLGKFNNSRHFICIYYKIYKMTIKKSKK